MKAGGRVEIPDRGKFKGPGKPSPQRLQQLYRELFNGKQYREGKRF